MSLIKRFYSSGTENTNKGSNVPPYIPTYNNSLWYSGSGSYFYNIVETNGTNDVYIQYGENKAPWVTAKFYNYEIKIIETEDLENNEIRAKIEVTAKSFLSRKSVYQSGGVQVQHEIFVDNVLKYSYSGLTTDEFTYTDPTTTEIIDVIIPPQTGSTKGALNVRATYPNKEFPNANIYIGIELFNNKAIPPQTYIPMAIRKSNTWLSLDDHDGHIRKRVSNNWLDYSEEEYNTELQENKGHNRIRRTLKWLQLPKMEV